MTLKVPRSARDDTESYLRTPVAIRERAEMMLKYVEDGRSAWFQLDADGLDRVLAFGEWSYP